MALTKSRPILLFKRSNDIAVILAKLVVTARELAM